MYEAGEREVPSAEGHRDLTHVFQDPDPAGAVGRIALELDPATVRERLEEVGRSVLIDPHRRLTSALHVGEGAVIRGRGQTGLGAGCAVGPGGARARQDEEQNGT